MTHNIKKKIELTILMIAILLGVAVTWSHAVYHRSLTATVFERILRAHYAYKDEFSYEDYKAELEAAAERDEQAYEDLIPFDEEFVQQTYNGLTTYYLNSSNHSNISILYLHGGGYVNQCSSWQWRLVNDLANRTDAEIITPDYPLAPWHTYEEAYELLYDWYVPWQEANASRILIIMGDSAGGGLALGFTEYLRDQGAALPRALALLSPWVDLTMSNPDIDDYEDVEPMLKVAECKAIAEIWAGDTFLTDYRLSPIYGDLTDLPDVYIITGSREILYPDAVLLYERLEAAGNWTTLVVGEGMNHDYLLFDLPEARSTRAALADWITAFVD